MTQFYMFILELYKKVHSSQWIINIFIWDRLCRGSNKEGRWAQEAKKAGNFTSSQKDNMCGDMKAQSQENKLSLDTCTFPNMSEARCRIRVVRVSWWNSPIGPIRSFGFILHENRNNCILVTSSAASNWALIFPSVNFRLISSCWSLDQEALRRDLYTKHS